MAILTTPPTTATIPEPRAVDPEKLDLRRGWIAGFLAGLLMLVALIVLRAATGALSLIDSLADGFLLYIPMRLFSLALDIFGAQAKTLLEVGLFDLLLFVTAWAGRAYARRTHGAKRVIWPRIAMVWLVAFGLSAIYVLFYGSQQLPGEIGNGKIVPVMLVIAAATGIYAGSLGLILHLLRSQSEVVQETGERPVVNRRLLITNLSLAVAGVAALGVVGREVARVAGRKISGGGTGKLSSAITPSEDFYVISKNFVDPNPDRGEDWSVTITGAVDRDLKLTRADLEAMVRPDFVSTLTCISNPIGGDLISTARWTGASLGDVLRKAGVQPNAVDLEAEGEDGYMDSIPIERALGPEPAIVWALNGEPLPREHGEPVRLIVPGLYGIKNVKWLTKLTVVTSDSKGFWQNRGWTDTAIIKTSSRIDIPGNKDVFDAGEIEVGGIAFAGDRGISMVELSTDDGATWTEAPIIENPSPAGLSWVIWKTSFDAKPGSYALRVRATDGTGELQTSERADELPDGASGWHKVNISVA